jgi:hypothetical protein
LVMKFSYDVLSTPNNCVQLGADQREAVASRKIVFALAPFPFSLEIFGTARSRQGRAGFARRSAPLTARTVREHKREGKGGGPIHFRIPPPERNWENP